LHQFLVRPIRITQVGIDRRRRRNRGPHAFEDCGLAAVCIIREGRSSRGSLILTAIRRRVLVRSEQFLVGPIVIGDGGVARLHRLLRRGQLGAGGKLSPQPATQCSIRVSEERSSSLVSSRADSVAPTLARHERLAYWTFVSSACACARPSPEGDEPPLKRLPFRRGRPNRLYGP
jgi:hypothetical protein